MTKRAILRVRPEFLLRFFQEDLPEIVVSHNPIPKDAKVINCMMDFRTGDILLLLESVEFREVREGATYEELRPPLFKQFESIFTKMDWLAERNLPGVPAGATG